jgi:Zn-dependent peptidase ImmA (M78 family)
METDRQARARSFAAEFLAPAEGIRRRLGQPEGEWVEEDTIDELAQEFDVSSFVIGHQIRNHNLGQVAF